MITKSILPVFLAALWISISEFVRNEFLLKSFWVDHYSNLGLTFPSDSVHGMVWGIWSLLFAMLLFILSKKYRLAETTFVGWFAGFVMMWVVIGNMNVLPYGILPYAVPLSLFETFFAVWIIRWFSVSNETR